MARKKKTVKNSEECFEGLSLQCSLIEPIQMNKSVENKNSSK